VPNTIKMIQYKEGLTNILQIFSEN